MNITTPVKKKAPARSWACQECGKTFSVRAVEKVMLSVQGCPACGGADFAILPRDTNRRRVEVSCA